MILQEIEYSAHFKKAYQHLDVLVQRKAEQKEVLFRKNPFDPILKTHKLHGKLKDFYSFSINRKTRIVFQFVDRAQAVFLDIGGHDVYQ
ncbi:MAG: type II toxin-antitoxin system mRNA interferase toxin, RelE/StbE family [Patescibacteria group bacterium]